MFLMNFFTYCSPVPHDTITYHSVYLLHTSSKGSVSFTDNLRNVNASRYHSTFLMNNSKYQPMVLMYTFRTPPCRLYVPPEHFQVQLYFS